MSTDLALLNSLADLAARINAEHEAITAAFRHGVARAFVAGELLNRAKSELPHGAWLPWLKANCPIPQRTCQLYMRLAEHREEIESANLAHLTIDAATKLLGGPPDLAGERRQLNERAASVLQGAIDIGRHLADAKERIGDRQAFLTWAKDTLGFSEGDVGQFGQIFEIGRDGDFTNFKNSDLTLNLNPLLSFLITNDALAAAEPPVPPEAEPVPQPEPPPRRARAAP